jgi:hypothetical protein
VQYATPLKRVLQPVTQRATWATCRYA